MDKWRRRKKGGLESKVKLNTGPDLGTLAFAMARVIIPLAQAAQTGSSGVSECKRRDCNYQQKAQEIKSLSCWLCCQTAALSHTQTRHLSVVMAGARERVHEGVQVFLRERTSVLPDPLPA